MPLMHLDKETRELLLDHDSHHPSPDDLRKLASNLQDAESNGHVYGQHLRGAANEIERLRILTAEYRSSYLGECLASAGVAYGLAICSYFYPGSGISTKALIVLGLLYLLGSLIYVVKRTEAYQRASAVGSHKAGN